MLDDVADPFVDSLSQYVAAVHRTTTTADFVPRQRRPYRVPNTVKHEAGRPSQELRDRDLSRPSDSPMASPLVGVARRDGDGSSAGDYRHMNLIYRFFRVFCYLYVYICQCIYSVRSELCRTKTDLRIIQCRSILCIVRLYMSL